jgi:hypothetical protein
MKSQRYLPELKDEAVRQVLAGQHPLMCTMSAKLAEILRRVHTPRMRFICPNRVSGFLSAPPRAGAAMRRPVAGPSIDRNLGAWRRTEG